MAGAMHPETTMPASAGEPAAARRPQPLWFDRALFTVALAGLLAGLAARLAGAPQAASLAWAATTLAVLLPLGASVARALLRGKTGVDVIALLAMAAALALGEHLAGAVVALMLSGGQLLESLADARARRELSALVERAPRLAHRYEDGTLRSTELATIGPGDRLLVKPGEVVPVDGVVEGEAAVLDEAALTGEAVPVERRPGDQVMSGTVNAGGPFDLRAIASARESTYAGIVRLVEEAQAAKAPLVRLADRYAAFFLPLTLALTGAAWGLSGDPVRALAVLVVATPCPLILAAPIAIVAGISRAARRGVIIKGGGALETLARGRTLLLDKTGTVTGGSPVVTDVEPFGGFEPRELLRLAASLDQVSPHVLAAAIVRAGRERGLHLAFPTDVSEELGSGISGRVDGRSVALGKGEWIARQVPWPPEARRVRRRTLLEGTSSVFVAVDGALAGALLLEDPVRADAPRTLRALRRIGFDDIVLVTGDHVDLAETVGAALGVDRVLAERTPPEKVEAVRAELASGTVVMVGDGINDAPALAAADVGVALGARGATASSEAADVVLVQDRLDRLIEAVRVARRSRTIALQSILVGMGLSLAAMGFAAAGFLTPVAGALLQEAIDVAVIANALRALSGGRQREVRDGKVLEVGQRFRDEHRRLLPRVKHLRHVADRLDLLEPQEAAAELGALHRFLAEELLPHEEAEDAAVYPVVARLIGGEDPTAPMSRAHLEIAHLIRVFASLLENLPPEGPDLEDLRELRRVLYGLYAILRLHFAQEDEAYLSLIDTEGPAGEAERDAAPAR